MYIICTSDQLAQQKCFCCLKVFPKSQQQHSKPGSQKNTCVGNLVLGGESQVFWESFTEGTLLSFKMEHRSALLVALAFLILPYRTVTAKEEEGTYIKVVQ